MKIIDGKDLVNMKFVKTEDGLFKEYKPQERFFPKKNEIYWFIDSNGYVCSHENTKHEIDNYIIEHTLIFRTQDECQDYKWFLEQLYKYKINFSKEEWEDRSIDKYYLYFEHNKNVVKTSYCGSLLQCNYDYFTEAGIIKFIETVGKERIKKYLFNIWE